MNEKQRKKLSEYLSRDISFLAVNYLSTVDSLSVSYYHKVGNVWYLTTDTIPANGEDTTRSVKVNAPRK